MKRGAGLQYKSLTPRGTKNLMYTLKPFTPADLMDSCKITLEMTHCEQPNIAAAHFRHSD